MYLSDKRPVHQMHSIIVGNEGYMGMLPRKFNTAVIGRENPLLNPWGNDLLFALSRKDEKWGFNIYLGGKNSFCAQNADIFIHPKNPPVRVNRLLTNFHLPKSTLIMLVASFIGLTIVLGARRRNELMVLGGFLGGLILTVIPLARVHPGFGIRLLAALTPLLSSLSIILMLWIARRKTGLSLAELLLCRYERGRMIIDTLGFAVGLILLITAVLLAPAAAIAPSKKDAVRVIAASAVLAATGLPVFSYAFKDYLEKCRLKSKTR